MHIFINDGLRTCTKKSIKVLEIGFGTGLNTFLTLLEAENTNKTIFYTALELYPVDVSEAVKLNYPEWVDITKKSLFEDIHYSRWNEAVKITDHFTLIKLLTDFTKADFSGKFDVIYFDAFSPEKQPEMWSEELFRKLYAYA
ncbi:MAG: hypothetical protein H6Q19_1453, partial [Bacteroidetes bacterium]|nr:hypothetical protein [Bacteroidota bacterium]